MAVLQPDATDGPSVQAGRAGQPFSWAIWIAISVVGAATGAIVGWQIRSLFPDGGQVAYLATLASALIAGGAQWLFFRTFKTDADWWAPATATASLLNAAIVVPSVLRLFFPPAMTSTPALAVSVTAGAVALAAAGLITGAAQALVLRPVVASAAISWIPVTVLGGALAGAVTTALSTEFYGLAPIATISLAAATGSVLTAGCQAPVVARILRR